MKIQSDIARQAWMNDPRLTPAQQATIQRTSQTDDAAEILGLDGNYLPVVKLMAGVPSQQRIFAIRSNGTPTEPQWEDPNESKVAGNLAEPWFNPNGRR